MIKDKRQFTGGDILVVDDKPANLKLLAQTLSHRGHQVRTVNSGVRALESAQAAPPELILLDIRMPEMDGFEVCRRLKETPNTSQIPIIFISALDDTEAKVTGFKLGGVDYITKPFHVEEVLARTETHLSLYRLQSALEEANHRYQLELDLAGKVQMSFLPQFLPDFSGWEFDAILKPARETSGDFYDIANLPAHLLGFLIADVMDKGVPAALLMALSSSLLWTYSERFPNSPDDVCREVSQSLLEHLDRNEFLTSFYGVLDPETGNIIYANAGHWPGIWMRASDESVELLRPTGPALGLLENGEWSSVSIEFDPGDLLLLYTDGVTEAMSSTGELFGMDRLIASMKSRREQPLQQLREGVLSDLAAFTGNTEQLDDISLMIIARTLT